MVARQAKNAPKGKDGKGTGGQFAKDTRGADPKNIPTAGEEEPTVEMLVDVEDFSYDDVHDVFEGIVKDSETEYIDLGDSSRSDWMCVCGNTAWEEDFLPYNGEGEEADPDDNWDGQTFFCAKCCRVFSKDTGAVVDRPESIVTLQGHITRSGEESSSWDDDRMWDDDDEDDRNQDD